MEDRVYYSTEKLEAYEAIAKASGSSLKTISDLEKFSKVWVK